MSKLFSKIISSLIPSRSSEPIAKAVSSSNDPQSETHEGQAASGVEAPQTQSAESKAVEESVEENIENDDASAGQADDDFVPYVNVHVSEESEKSELDAYDYNLPERLIAQSPLAKRENARLMIVDRAKQKISHTHVYDILEYLNPNDALVLNDTKVLPARLLGKRQETGGRWEGLFLQYDPRGYWEIMSKTRGKLRSGEKIELKNPNGNGYKRYLQVEAHTEAKTLIVKPLLEEGEDTFTFLDKVGWVPIPPYIRSGRMQPSDREDYQTVYARVPGAVAAPTAGLHFTTKLLNEIKEMGVAVCPVTLHVGAGTFKPISVTKLSEHHMHSEFATITDEVVQTLKARKAQGGRVFAIGTTSVRTLESASNVLDDGTIDSSGLNDKELQAFSGPTNLFIRPPYQFKTVDAMLTNFHLPKSTLVILVRTFGGDELLKRAYEEAIAEDYRFYSYGDAMLIL